jgi:hypothetical protein
MDYFFAITRKNVGIFAQVQPRILKLHNCTGGDRWFPPKLVRCIPYKEKKMKIDYKLVPFDHAAVFQITHMDESLRGDVNFEASNGMEIKSIYCTEISNDRISLRGRNKDQDFKPAWIVFKSNEERDDYIKKANAVIAEWVASLSDISKSIVGDDPLDMYRHRL